MASLEVRNLTLERGAFRLDFGLELPDGAFGVLLGPSGCGKSTALRLLAGLDRADSGSIRLGERELSGLPPEKRRVGLVFQDLALFANRTALGNIEYGPRLAGLPRTECRRRARELAAAFGIEDLLGRHPARLSGGERQRVALARSLAASPDLLLLDEPLSALDAALRRELRTEIRARISAAAIPALQVTHDIEEALALADRLYLMERGKIVESGRPEEVYDHPKTAFAARLLGRGPLIRLEELAFAPGRACGKTAFGGFFCPLPPEAAGRPVDWRLHFASGAATVEPIGETKSHEDNPERGAGSGPGGAAFRARLERATYIGEGWRLELRSPSGEGLVLESRGPLACRRGEEVSIRIPASALSLVQSPSSAEEEKEEREGTSKP